MAGRFTHLLTQTVTVAARTGIGTNGDPVFGSQASLPARVEIASKVIRGPAGVELQSDAVIATETAIARSSVVWLPGDSLSGRGRRVVLIKNAQTPDGETLYETYL